MYRFSFDNDVWALILGTWDDPDEYRVWGAWDTDPSVTGYNAWVLLREVHADEPTGSSRRLRQTSDYPNDEPMNCTRPAPSRKKKKRTSQKASLDQSCCDDWNLDRGDDDDDDEEIFKREASESMYKLHEIQQSSVLQVTPQCQQSHPSHNFCQQPSGTRALAVVILHTGRLWSNCRASEASPHLTKIVAKS